MIFVTGDTHGDFTRFSDDPLFSQQELTRDDYMIICGDCSLIWDYQNGSVEERYWIKWFAEKQYTLLFIDGNHENFDRLNQFPVENWKGGSTHKISDNIRHLMRGQIFTLNDRTFFTFGGAASHDIRDGIINLDGNEPFWRRTARQWERDGLFEYRINHVTWWKEELPGKGEIEAGIRRLAAHGNQVDYILTHEAPASDVETLGSGLFTPDMLSEALEMIKCHVKYKRWFFGHYHEDISTSAKCRCLYHDIVQIP